LNRNAGSREDVDKAEAASKKASAQVDADLANSAQSEADFKSNILAAQASVDTAEADLKNAQIDLNYCTIVSPIDGFVTRKFVDVGNLVGDTAATLLATVVKDDPIYAYMTASEADLLMFKAMVAKGERADFRKNPIPIALALSDETGFPHEGLLEYVDPAVDPSTGTIVARGTFPNPDRKVVGGLFVRVRVPLRDDPNALLVPERAVGTDPRGQFVLTVDKDNKVVRKGVTLGAHEGDLVVIEQGLTTGDLVVIDGLQRARPGLAVKPVTAVPPPAPAAAPSAG
jgi:membrane fusion protein (multidrug efflux system)